MECVLCTLWTIIHLTYFTSTPVSICPMVWRSILPVITYLVGRFPQRIRIIPSLLLLRLSHLLWLCILSQYITIRWTQTTTSASSLINHFSNSNHSAWIWHGTSLTNRKELKGAIIQFRTCTICYRTIFAGKVQASASQQAMKWSKWWKTRHHSSVVFAAILVQVYITVFGRAKVAR